MTMGIQPRPSNRRRNINNEERSEKNIFGQRPPWIQWKKCRAVFLFFGRLTVGMFHPLLRLNLHNLQSDDDYSREEEKKEQLIKIDDAHSTFFSKQSYELSRIELYIAEWFYSWLSSYAELCRGVMQHLFNEFQWRGPQQQPCSYSGKSIPIIGSEGPVHGVLIQPSFVTLHGKSLASVYIKKVASQKLLAKVFVCYRVDNSTNLFCENYTWYSMAIRLVRLRVSSSKRTSNGREKELTSSSQSRFKVTFQYYSVFIEVIL